MRFVEDPIDRVSGPMKFRLVLQPMMAALFAIRSGLADARAGKPPPNKGSRRGRPYVETASGLI